MLQRKKINDYLYYGYLFPAQLPENLFQLTPSKVESNTYNEKETAQLFDKLLDQALEECSANNYCVIPISGGWDSRILLGAAVERLSTSQIKTYSFGSPGQLDYEIGRKVSNFLGVEHHAIDVRRIEMNWVQLEEVVKEAPWTKPFDAYINRYCIKTFTEEGDIVLSGFMGDPLFGSHFSDYKDINECIRLFVKRQNITERSVLIESDYDPAESIPELPENNPFDSYDIVDFGIRQANMVAPIVTPLEKLERWEMFLGNFRSSGASIVAPFAHPEWVRYWAFAPKEFKKEKNLFFRMFQYKFPKLFEFPSKDYFGATKNEGVNRNLRRNFTRVQNRLHRYFPTVFSQSNKMLNYQDFDEQFRKNDDYQSILDSAITFLKDTNATDWIDFNELLSAHMTYKEDHAKSFQVIIGLALNMKVNNTIR